MAGLALFTFASLLCGIAWSPASLIAARALQGVGAAIMTPTALSIVTTTFPEGAERNKALGIWGSLGGVGGTAGWLIGGPLTDLDWRLIFLINVPVGVVALALAPRLLSESRAAGQPRAYDPAGALTITAALALLVYAVVEAPENGWGDTRTIGVLVGSAVLLALFAAIELRVAAPLLPLRILRSRTLVGANAVMLVFSEVGYGMPFVAHAVCAAGARLLAARVRAQLDRVPDRGHGGRDRRPGLVGRVGAAAGRDHGPDAAGGRLSVSRAGLGRRQLPGRHPDRAAAVAGPVSGWCS